MKNIFDLIAAVLTIVWLYGYYFFQAGSIIHILLVIAVVAKLISVVQQRKVA
jgi:hypothetical protein